MNRDLRLQRRPPDASFEAQESVESASASRQNHRQQSKQSADRLDEELNRLAGLYSPSDVVNSGAQ